MCCCLSIENSPRHSRSSPYSTDEGSENRLKKVTYCGREWQLIGGLIALGAVVLLILGGISHGGHITLSEVVRKAFTYAGAAVTGIVLIAGIAYCCRCCLDGLRGLRRGERETYSQII